MGTNYYMITKNKDIAHEFAEKLEYGDTVEYIDGEYELCDEPDFHYEIHLNKLSCGWKPLFQIHRPFKSFVELEQFCDKYKDNIEFKDEYGDKMSFEEYKDTVIRHSEREPEPMKWVYEENKICGKPGRKYLQTVSCEPKEADLWIPFDHILYGETEREVRQRFQAWDTYVGSRLMYWRDPDYEFDWVEGDFV